MSLQLIFAILQQRVVLYVMPAFVAQLDERLTGNQKVKSSISTRSGSRNISFIEIDHGIFSTVILSLPLSQPQWLIWMRRPTGDQEAAGSTPAEVGNILSRRLIVKYFLLSFSPFR